MNFFKKIINAFKFEQIKYPFKNGFIIIDLTVFGDYEARIFDVDYGDDFGLCCSSKNLEDLKAQVKKYIKELNKI